MPDRVGETARDALKIGKDPVTPFVPQFAQGRCEIAFVIHVFFFLAAPRSLLLEGFQGICRGRIRRSPKSKQIVAETLDLAKRGEIEVSAQARKQQRTDMELQSEITCKNELGELVRRDQPDLDAFFCVPRAWASFHKE